MFLSVSTCLYFSSYRLLLKNITLVILPSVSYFLEGVEALWYESGANFESDQSPTGDSTGALVSGSLGQRGKAEATG